MCTHNICFEQNYENSFKKIIITENCHFYSREISLYIAWACFRNVLFVGVFLASKASNYSKLIYFH